MTNIMDMFPDRVQPEPNSGCWLWTGAIRDNRWTYGSIMRNYKRHRAHRVSFEMSCGPIPEGKQVLHKCDVMLCVNPTHLYLGDDAQNVRDKFERGRANILRGSRHGAAKLTDEQVREIRRILPGQRLPDGMGKTLSQRFGVGRDYITLIRKGAERRDVA